jgi:hypothetical protein
MWQVKLNKWREERERERKRAKNHNRLIRKLPIKLITVYKTNI